MKCRMCGGDVVLVEGQSCGTCDHCGSAMTLPKVSDGRRLNLFNRADHFRRLNEFDRAVAAYESLLNEDNTDAEAHWGLALSRFGIEYVEDPKTHERLPTCHRVQTDSILRDADYQLALEHAPDSAARALYERQGAQIAEIQKGLLALSAQEEPYDIFICYKESSDGGSRTRDSVLAQEIYHQLNQEEYRVFFARISLENRLGQAYEPCIFAALNSARVMVVVGTKPEHFNAAWVRNEWSRYLSLRKKDSRKLIIPCYRDMNPYDLPEELSGLQSQDMEKIGFIQDLVRGIKKVLDDEKAPVAPSALPGAVANSEVVALVKRARLFLEDGEFKSAEEYAEKALDKDPECAEAYLAKLMVALKVKTEEQLGVGTEPLTGNSLYQKAVRFSSGPLRKQIEACNRKRQEEAERQRLAVLEQDRRNQLEKERQENQLGQAAELVDRGDLEEAGNLLGALNRALVNVSSVEAKLDHRSKELAELEASAGNILKDLAQLESDVAAFFPFPRFGLRDRSRRTRKEATERLTSLRSGAAQHSGSEWARRIESAAGEVHRALVKFESATPIRIDKQLRFWVKVWLASVAAVLIAIAAQVVEAKLKEHRIAAAAKAAADAEEMEKLRLLAEAKAKAEKEFSKLLTSSAGTRMVVGESSRTAIPCRWIPAGRFMMGSPSTEENRGVDEALHDVTLTGGTLLAETECAQSQWEAVMGSSPSTFKGADRPVETVSWDQAAEFCRKLTKMHQDAGAMPQGWAWRLPTEAEWEYAARAGTTGPRHGELDAIAWHSGNSGSETHPVKQKAANAWGLHDMIGNVWEWCSDRYGDYPTGAVTDPTGPSSGSLRVFRGGSWCNAAGRCRSADRNGLGPGLRDDLLGFRPVLSSVR